MIRRSNCFLFYQQYVLQLYTKAIIFHIGFTFITIRYYNTSLMAKRIQFVIGSGRLLFLFWFENILLVIFVCCSLTAWNSWNRCGNSIFVMQSCRYIEVHLNHRIVIFHLKMLKIVDLPAHPMTKSLQCEFNLTFLCAISIPSILYLLLTFFDHMIIFR